MKVNFDPTKNDRVIAIVLQDDGNYIGYAQKFGNVVEVRDIGPETVLQRLLTHDGNTQAH